MLRGLIHRARNRVVVALRGETYLKERSELAYWQRRQRKEQVLANTHFAYFFTTHFGLEEAFYHGKRVLDIGCGPRGSLEWASGADERVGLDPLADSYRALGTDAHAMQYVCAPAERIPFADGHFDVVSSFNSLDHVEDLDATIAEIGRVTAPGGRLLLLVEVNHPPTPCEPISFSWDVVQRFQSQFEPIEERHYESHPKGMYDAIWEDLRYDHEDTRDRTGWLSTMLRRRTAE